MRGPTKVFAPVVLDAVVECLRTIYWYQEDLRSFLTRAGVPQSDLGELPWGSGIYKRTIARRLVDGLASDPRRGMPVLERLVDSIVEMNESMPHLVRLNDGKAKAREASAALAALKDLLGKESVADRADRARQESRTEADRVREQRIQRERDLISLKSRFHKLCALPDGPGPSQRRGLDFQNLLRDLFALHDLDPRSSFAGAGEQIDGSIAVDGTFVLVEARWEKESTEPKGVRDFQGKVQTKLDNTLGLMISMSGFTEHAIREAEKAGRILVVLMDGTDLAQVFEGIVDLTELIRRKLRRAAENGRAMYHVGE